MAGLNIDLNKEISLGKQSRGKMPTKTSINLVIKKESFLSSKKAVPTIIACVVLACLLIGFFIVRPVVELTRTNAKVASLQAQLDEANKTIESMGGIEEEYAHYTTDGMTAEELARADRVKVMKLVENAVVNSGAVKSWSLTENIMTLEVTGSSLSELNQIAGALEQESIVERCVIYNANKGTSNNGGPVDVTFTVYLNSAGSMQDEGSVVSDDSVEEARKAAEARGEAAYSEAEEGLEQ